MLALHPELVHVDQNADDAAARKPTWEVVPAPQEIIAPSGVLWRPSEGTAEIGRLYLDFAAERVETPCVPSSRSDQSCAAAARTRSGVKGMSRRRRPTAA
jgi:creatinine amidohydrolase/Fe(II)-dependent formamide hydrolase-like protein